MSRKSMIEKVLKQHGADRVIFRRNGEIKAIMGYYYRDNEKFNAMRDAISGFYGAEIIDSGDHWHEFVGGSRVGTANSSYMWVTFKLHQPEVIQ